MKIYVLTASGELVVRLGELTPHEQQLLDTVGAPPLASLWNVLQGRLPDSYRHFHALSRLVLATPPHDRAAFLADLRAAAAATAVYWSGAGVTVDVVEISPVRAA